MLEAAAAASDAGRSRHRGRRHGGRPAALGQVANTFSNYCKQLTAAQGEGEGPQFMPARPWWYLDKQVAGRFVEYHRLSMVTVRGAGHLVPLNKPAEGLTVINAFLRGEQLPTHR
ncbi:hypothetical protein PAHAL_3G128400 [Panicum hallii]|uniref:Carboxypeptidase n=1 Tax=Panicum hallii TaxID=206008 RepID=A0A2S3H8B2_9POAL|nr:serine carboxypeptidase-like 33 [Panicum hallii]PAN17394.1 hypothetical protein PAHAL_3G128400 [Panicum hallii]